MMFADGDEEGVAFVVELGVGGEVGLAVVLDEVVVGVGVEEAVAGEDAIGIRVDNEDLAVEGVEEDGVGGFAAYAVDGEEVFAKGGQGDVCEGVEVGVVFFDEPADEVFEAFGFDVVVACGANGFGEFEEAGVLDGLGGEEVSFFEAVDGAFDVGPVGVLGEDGADENLEGGIGGPPVLRAVVIEEGMVEVEELGGVA